MNSELKIGIVGLDTSHVTAFTKLLNDPKNPYHVAGGRVTVAFPGGSPDFELSRNRVEGFTAELRDKLGVKIVDSIESVGEQSDVILLESVDGRVHLEQFKKLVAFKKPIFIDKPLAISSSEAQAISDLARQSEVPVMTASALRFAEALTQVLEKKDDGEIFGVDCYGIMTFVPTQTGYFWYGIHTVEMVYAALGKGCKQVNVVSNEHHDAITGIWEDGRLAMIRGNRKENSSFGGTIHRPKTSLPFNLKMSEKPHYACLIEKVMCFFKSGKSPVSFDESIEVIRFLEAANESRESGNPIILKAASKLDQTKKSKQTTLTGSLA